MKSTGWRLLSRLRIPAMVVALSSANVSAHHSTAIFDMEKELKLTGVVKEFQFNNPHCFIQLLAQSEQGEVEWSIEMGSPTHLMRSGWKRNTLKSGDRIEVLIHPVREGGATGQFVSVSYTDGKPVLQP